MLRKYNISYRLVASILLVSLFLQSCGNPLNQLSPQEKEPTVISLGPGRQMEIIKQLAEQKLILEGWEVIDMYEEKDGLKIEVIERHGNFTSKPYVLSISIDPTVNLEQLTCLSTEAQNRFVYIPGSKYSQPGHVIIAKEGLRGGMMEEDDQQGQKNKELVKEKKVQSQQKTKEQQKVTWKRKEAQQKVSNHKEKCQIARQNNNPRATRTQAVAQKFRPATAFPKEVNDVSSYRRNYPKKGDKNEIKKKKPILPLTF